MKISCLTTWTVFWAVGSIIFLSCTQPAPTVTISSGAIAPPIAVGNGYSLFNKTPSDAEGFHSGDAASDLSLIAVGPYSTGVTTNANLFFFDSEGKVLSKTNVEKTVWAVDMTPDGKTTAVGSDNSQLYIFKGTQLVASGVPIQGNAEIRGVAVSNDGKYAGAGGIFFTLHDLSAPNPITPIFYDKTLKQCRAIDFSADGRYVAYGGRTFVTDKPQFMYLGVYDLLKKQQVFTDTIGYSKVLAADGQVNAELRHLSISSDGKYIVAGNWQGEVIFYVRSNPNDNKWERKQITVVNQRVYWTDMDNAATSVVIGKQDSKVLLYEITPNGLQQKWERGGFDGGPRIVSITENGELISAGSRGGGAGGGQIVVFNKQGQEILRYASDNAVTSEAWFSKISSDGKKAVLASMSGHIYFFKK